MPTAPPPIDPRGPRFNQALVATLLLIAFVADWRVLVPLVGAVLLAGVAFGPTANPFLAFYSKVVRPRLRAPAELEDPRPPRFAAAVGVVFLAAASALFLAGAVTAAWVLALIVAALAGLAAGSGICVGCEVYLVIARLRGRPLRSRVAART
jgi:uncharacterized membrane protein